MNIRARLNNYQPSSSTLAKFVVGLVLLAFLGFLIGPLGLGREFAWGGLKLIIGTVTAGLIVPLPFKTMKQADGTPGKRLDQLFSFPNLCLIGDAAEEKQEQDTKPKANSGSSYAKRPYKPAPKK